MTSSSDTLNTDAQRPPYRCSECAADLLNAAVYCPKCHAILCAPDEASAPRSSQIQGSDDSTEAPSQLLCMVRGDLGVGPTFWQYQVLWPALLGIPCLAVAAITESAPLLILIALVFTALNLASLLGLWRAAARCPEGSGAATAARIWVILSLLGGVISLMV